MPYLPRCTSAAIQSRPPRKLVSRDRHSLHHTIQVDEAPSVTAPGLAVDKHLHLLRDLEILERLSCGSGEAEPITMLIAFAGGIQSSIFGVDARIVDVSVLGPCLADPPYLQDALCARRPASLRTV